MIPAFVFRGLAAMENGDPFSIRYRTEADLRDALAALWWMQGLEVRTEVDVPNCGRIDVMGEFLKRRCVVELKRKITTPSEARKAFMQAHSYKAYLDSERDPAAMLDENAWVTTEAIVTCGEQNLDAITPAQSAFSQVDYLSFYSAAALPNWWRLNVHEATVLHQVALSRIAAMDTLRAAAHQMASGLGRVVENFSLSALAQEGAPS